MLHAVACPSVTWVDQLKMVEVRMMKFAVGVPRRQSHRRPGVANLPSVGAVP